MRELRYAASAVFFIIILFMVYLAYLYIKPYISVIVLVVVLTSLSSFVILMGAVSLSIWRAFSVSGKVEEIRAKIVKRVPRKKT